MNNGHRKNPANVKEQKAKKFLFTMAMDHQKQHTIQLNAPPK